MKALILAAGMGTRLGALTLEVPKPMILVGDRPLLAHAVGWLRAHGISEIAMNLHHRPESITGYFGDGSAFGVQMTYSHETTLLGTAGAARRLAAFLDEPFVLVYGDVYTNLDLGRLAAVHARHRPACRMTLALYRVTNPTECGLVETDAAGRVLRFVEKPPAAEVFTDLANAGVALVEPEVVGAIADDRPSDFGRDVIPHLLGSGQTLAAEPLQPGEFVIDIGTPAGLERAQATWAAQQRPAAMVTV